MSADKENAVVPSTPPAGSKGLSSPLSSDHSQARSPKRSLRPLSPNKTNSSAGSGVGKLNFLQNDNIDEHFNYIHTTHDEIQEQLNSLETCTKQTAADLGQLVDRSKNNNQHLNKLLQNIASYSDEVITEGNATKNDITNIISKLDSFSDQIKQFASDRHEHLQLENHINSIKSSISQSLSQIPTTQELTTVIESLSTKSSLTKDIQTQISSLQDSIPSTLSHDLKQLIPALLRQELAQHEQSLNTSTSKLSDDLSKLPEVLRREYSQHEQSLNTSTSKQSHDLNQLPDLLRRELSQQNSRTSTSKAVDEKMEALTNTISNLPIPSVAAISSDIKHFIRTELESLLSSKQVDRETLAPYLVTNDTISSIVPPIKAELNKMHQSSLEAESSRKEELKELVSRVPDPLKEEQLANSVSELTSSIKSQSELINELLAQSQIKQATSDLQSKHADLEAKYNLLHSKYSQLCTAYESKYTDLQHLNLQYQSLTQKSGNLAGKLMSAADDSPSQDVAINKSPLAKLSGARQLHNYSMGTIPQLESQATSPQKRIVSSPVANKVGRDYLHELSNIRSNNSDDDI